VKIELDYQGETYEVETDRVLDWDEGVLIEQIWGGPIPKWEKAVQDGYLSAIKPFLFVYVKRRLPEIRYKDFNFPLDAVRFIEEEGDDDGPGESEGEDS